MRTQWIVVVWLVAAGMMVGSVCAEDDLARFEGTRAPEDAIWLDTLDLSKATQGWGNPQKGRSVDGNPIQIDGNTFEHGFGTHATSVLRIRLNGAATKFESLVGVDDEVEDRKEPSARFMIMVDDEIAARTPVMHAGDDPRHLSAELTDAEQMTLIVTDGGDSKDYDHADWAGALLHLDQSVSEEVEAEQVDRSTHIASPDGAINPSLYVDSEGNLGMKVDYKDETFIPRVRLGVTIGDVDLGSEVYEIRPGETTEHSQEYPTFGVHGRARGDYRTVDVNLRRTSERLGNWQIQLRCYNDGVAYRYKMPEGEEHTVNGETNTWDIPEATHVWHQHDLKDYEGVWHGEPVRALYGHFGSPITMEMPGGSYAVLGEASVYGYSGMSFSSPSDDTRIECRFRDDNNWTVSGGSYSPWRFVMISPDLNGLVNSDLVTNLNPTPDTSLFPQGYETEWIQPGRAVWRWWSRGTGTPEQERQYIDYAAQLGFEYSLIDAGWPDWEKPWERMEELVEYAAQKDVKLWLWRHWKKLRDPESRESFFSKVAKTGLVGVKVDFMDSESHDRLQFYRNTLIDAAEHKLMINYHGANKPAGGTRTYPNEMTREGVRGLEYNRFGYPLLPRHNAVLPFTREVVGFADYTPLTLNEDRLGETTFTHQLATVFAFTSPVAHIAGYPGRILEHEDILDVLKAFPPSWDETRILDMTELGEVTAMARRKDSEWFLVVLNGSVNKARTFTDVDLEFLSADDAYHGVCISDRKKTEFERQELSDVTRQDTIDINLRPGGGYVAWFSPEGKE